ncbi:DLST component of 2-OG dehydrogenase complex, mitochondrial [Amphibalanus amphitrite]|uniref:Dihydrolipoyllysine-residue succinyltransferase component of 2-oxoglutarate dehydrogenase complex, mitochondrial n=1 Tax=Amphibalanus amphitrite TaxID=1232801 RepID=A0A6A4WUS0_AMPAM|nr:DLST component of 2-OG dehydrogenase complex, mitochondrial [Amphibalanus amphitrite]
MFADDTSTLCAGNSIAVARDRAQLAANTLVKWARRSKMEVAGQKTQLLVLSQNPRDAVDCHIHVAGQLVEGGPELKLLGVTLDRTLSFGPHCRSLRRRVRPRAAQLRRLTGRSWGLQEQQLRAVANGYVRGAIEHAAAAWLPAVSKSNGNIEILEREMRAVARIVTGCIHSAPHHGVTAEAGMLPVAARRTALAARMFAKAAALPPEDPLRAVAMADPPQRLKLVTGWRQVGREALRELRVELPVEALLPERPPPWTPTGKITFNLSIGALPAAGTLCSSFRAEMVALQVTLDHILEHQRDAPEPVVICTDSLSAIAALREGPSAQRSARGAAIWKQLLELTAGDRTVTLQWVPSHCGIPENESADALATEAATLAQEDVMLDVDTIYRAAVEIRPMMYVALTYDHRLIDGREAVTFLRHIKAAVEDPRVLLLGL